MMRGVIDIALGKTDLAIKDLDKCIEMNGRTADAYANRAFAKIVQEEKLKINFVSVKGGTSNEVFISNWTVPLCPKSKKNTAFFITALEDCKLAIKLNPNFDYAYYVRGHVKKLLGAVDYCADFLKAAELGYAVNPEILKECRK
jgi:tetratricopeptide (TPR) repeat protein